MMWEKSAIHWWASGGEGVCENPPYHFSFHGLNQCCADPDAKNMCVFASYELAGNCMRSSGPCTASANRTMAPSASTRPFGTFDTGEVGFKGDSSELHVQEQFGFPELLLGLLVSSGIPRRHEI